MSNDKIALAAGLVMLAAAHKAITGSNVKALQTKATGVSTEANVAANGYGQNAPAQVPTRSFPLPVALESSGLPLVNPLVDYAPSSLYVTNNQQSLIRDTQQSYDPRGATQAERDARVNLTQYPTSYLINSRLEEAMKEAREIAQLQQGPVPQNGMIVPL